MPCYKKVLITRKLMAQFTKILDCHNSKSLCFMAESGKYHVIFLKECCLNPLVTVPLITSEFTNKACLHWGRAMGLFHYPTFRLTPHVIKGNFVEVQFDCEFYWLEEKIILWRVLEFYLVYLKGAKIPGNRRLVSDFCSSLDIWWFSSYYPSHELTLLRCQSL